MFQKWIKQKERHKNPSKVSFALIFSVLFLTLGFVVAKAPLKSGVQYTVVTDLPETMVLDETYTMRVDCKNVGTMPYDVWAEITIYGPNGEEFTSNDIFINWVSYDENGKMVSNFTLGRNLWGWGAHVDFTQVNGNVINWTGDRTRMNPGVYRRHTLYASILGSAPLGNYRVVANVLGEKPPIEAEVSITPQTLNVKSEGESIQARIRLPAPYNVKDVGINSVKLEYKDSFVQAEWEGITGNSLLVKFSRGKVNKMLESEEGKVNLIVTGLVNGVEFYGTDTITIIGP
jgi:hypothetical protein